MLDEWSPLPASTELEVEAGGWYLYRFFTRLPCAVPGCTMRHPLYIGKSNDPLRRWLEHAPKQWWWPLQCGYEIDVRVWPSDAAVRGAETAAIHAELPLANDACNGGNVHRLTPTDVPARRPNARSAGRLSAKAPEVPGRKPWTTRQRMVAGYTTFWALFAAVLWWVCAPRLPGGWAALAGSGGAVVPTLAGALHRPRRRRRRR